MAKIADLLAEGRTTTSFEFFPPKTEKGEANLREAVAELEQLKPSFVSVTYGAAGSTREKTRDVVTDIKDNTSLTAMPHLTCIAHTRDELREIIEGYRADGFENLLALHGDAPKDNPDMGDGDFERAHELVDFIREVGDFSVGVATHPEGHPKAPSHEEDRQHQAAKLRVADFGITQFFFRVEDYLRLMDDLSAHDVNTPVIAGVIPITDAKQVQRFAELSGADMPRELVERLDAVADDPDEVFRIGVEVATDLADRLLEAGAPGLHFYTLNRSAATVEVFRNLGFAN